MRNKEEKCANWGGCRQGCQQGPSADNQFEAQVNRLKSLYNIKPMRGSDEKLAKVLGVERQTVNTWKKRGISKKRAIEICENKKIDPNWLFYGKKAARKEELRVAEERAQYQESPEIPVPEGLDAEYFELVPVVETYLNAGGGAFIPSELICGYCAFRKHWLHRVTSSPKNAILVPIRGPSMEPTILAGDMVMIDAGRLRIYDGCIYAIGIGETISIKRLYLLSDGRIRTVSDNRKYPEEEVSPEDLRVIGQVIWFARELIK